jgi:hypothetical protein
VRDAFKKTPMYHYHVLHLQKSVVQGFLQFGKRLLLTTGSGRFIVQPFEFSISGKTERSIWLRAGRQLFA